MRKLVVAALMLLSTAACAEHIGEVDTVFKLLGPDHKIVVDAYDDPEGGGRHLLRVARQDRRHQGRAGPGRGQGGGVDRLPAGRARSRFAKPLPEQEEMFSERISLVFKKLRVVRMVDRKRNTLVYLTYSDRVIEGSPQNSVTAVPVDRGHADSGEVTCGGGENARTRCRGRRAGSRGFRTP